MSVGTVLKLAVWAVFVMIVLQVVFFFVFEAIGYDLYVLSLTLILSLVVWIMVFAGWRLLRRTIK